MHTPPSSVPHAKSTITTTAATFWMNRSFAELVPLKRATLVLIPNQEALKQLAFCSGDREQTCVKLVFLVQATKNLAVASKRDYSNIPCTNTTDEELNQSSLKSMPRRHLIRGHLHKENTYVRTWGYLNSGESVCSKGA